MSIYKCPKGHQSTESDYCSECGVKIPGINESTAIPSLEASTIPASISQVINCPDCGAIYATGSGNFCEICGYNFITGADGELPLDSSAIFQPNLGSSSAPSTQTPIIHWELVATIDSSLGNANSPPPPLNQPAITFRLDKETNLIGRSSKLKGIRPEISLDFDDAVSRRHALLIRQLDGSFILRDIGSANGTKLKGVELQPMVDVPIKEGDQFTLGHWTRITVKVIRLP